jgi:two-component system, cell cycle response regulator DivK
LLASLDFIEEWIKIVPETVIDPKDACVLVVEDNLQNTVLISRLLDFLGVRQYEWKASSWQISEAIERMPQVDLVLLDLHLPHEDGYAVLTKIRSDPRTATSRVVAVTADAHPETMEQVRRAGFDGFLGKPIDPEKFPDQITQILQGEGVWDLGYR